jgi:P27 family predicted phage terminase small subunit
MPANRLPENVRRLRGYPPRVPPTLPAIPKPPDWLPKAAKVEWRRIVDLAGRYEGWLQAVDRAALAGYCMAWATFESVARDVAENGALIPGRSTADRGRMVKNPAVQIMRDESTQMRYWARELGFTPDARGRIDVRRWQDDDESDLD